MPQAAGSFTVKLQPQQDDSLPAPMGRLALEKEFSGDIAGRSQGQMLSATTATRGSAGYVAIETFTGSLAGRTGSFTLQHSGAMHRGTPSLSITVVPDSGTGELVGLTGSMQINISEGHTYTFDYALAPEPPTS